MTPWEQYPDIWSTQSKFMSWVRGGIRRGLWNKYPIKLLLLSKRLERKLVGKFKNGKPKYLKLGTCDVCGEEFRASQLEVDHKTGGHSLRTMEDVQAFIENMIMVAEEDLQLICKPCHKIKSHAERMGLSFDEAALEKGVVAVCKLKAAEQLAWLKERGVEPAKNAEARKEQIREVLSEAK